MGNTNFIALTSHKLSFKDGVVSHLNLANKTTTEFDSLFKLHGYLCTGNVLTGMDATQETCSVVINKNKAGSLLCYAVKRHTVGVIFSTDSTSHGCAALRWS